MLRALSSLESFYVDQQITILTVNDLQGTINALILQKALATVVMMHPLLASEIQQSSEGYFFSKRDSYNDDIKIIGNVDKAKRKKIIFSELNTPLTNNNLIRCTLLLEERVGLLKPQNISLLLTIHHAVSDGISSIALLQQIWKVYATISNNEAPEITEFHVMPSIENLVPNAFMDAELKNYIDDYAKKSEQFQPYTLPPAEQAEQEIEISYVRKKFTLKQTQEFLNKCKEHEVTAHGLICAANLLAMRDLFGKDAPLDVSCHSPINVRSRLQPVVANNEMFSAAIGCIHCEKVSAETSLWELAKNISNTINQHIQSGDIFKSILTYQETRMKAKLPVTIGVTNVGVVEMINPSRKLKSIAVNFIPRIPLPMLAVCVCTSGDKLTITYPYAKPFYSTNSIKKIADAAVKYLI